MKIILINVKSSAKYLAGKYQMRFFTANTFYRFVNQFSFIEKKTHNKSINTAIFLKIKSIYSMHYVSHPTHRPVRHRRDVKMHINLTIGY